MKKYYLIFSLIICVIFVLISCEEESIDQSTLTTTVISSITSNEAVSGGSISSNGGASITVRGVCWSETENPTIENNLTTDGNGDGSFVSNIEGLEDSTTYYIRAYATNEKGTSYGNELTFTTLSALPKLTTIDVSNIAQFSANSGGNIFYTGGLPITSRGVCWSETENPTIENDFTTDGNGDGSFVSNIEGLNENTTYYIKAYATNQEGTKYGQQLSFKTLPELPLLSTVSVNDITQFTVSCNVEIEAEGISSIIEKGVCWSKNQNPTINDNKLAEGSDKDSFTSLVENLDANVAYSIRGFATNSAGTSYGNELTFKTLPIIDIDGNEYSTVAIGTQVWLVENLKTTKYNDGTEIPLITDADEWRTLTTPGYCWYDNDEDTYKSLSGALYNWRTIGTGKLCPSGWHVPTDEEWSILIDYLGGEDIAGSKMKATSWSSSNESGFTALPGGSRGDLGSFHAINSSTWWWSSTHDQSVSAWARNVNNFSNVNRDCFYEGLGLSVRCLKD